MLFMRLTLRLFIYRKQAVNFLPSAQKKLHILIKTQSNDSWCRLPENIQCFQSKELSTKSNLMSLPAPLQLNSWAQASHRFLRTIARKSKNCSRCLLLLSMHHRNTHLFVNPPHHRTHFQQNTSASLSLLMRHEKNPHLKQVIPGTIQYELMRLTVLSRVFFGRYRGLQVLSA